MENLLFIGGAGFIGSNIIHSIESKDTYNVYILEPKNANISRIKRKDITLLYGNLSDLEFIEGIILKYKITKLIHLVSTLIPGSDFIAFENEFNSVITPTSKLIRLCSKYGIQFIYFSSGGTIYGNRDSIEPFFESDPLKPISFYGLSKQIIENCILFEHRTSNLNYLILRPSNPYGPGQNINGKQGLIAVSLGKILNNKEVEIWGDGRSLRDYIYIDDLSKIFCQLITRDINNTILNIGSGKGYSVSYIMDVLKKVTNESFKIKYLETRKSDVSNMILDLTLLKSIVDIEFTSIEAGVSNFFNYEKQNFKL